MKVESVWNDSEDLKNAVWGWADRIGVHGAGGAST